MTALQSEERRRDDRFFQEPALRRPQVRRWPLTVKTPHCLFQLFVSGSTIRSLPAIHAVKAACDAYLPKRPSLEITDIRQQPELAASAQTTVVPAPVKKFPDPLRRFTGNRSTFGGTDEPAGRRAQERLTGVRS